ncbi:MAG: twin-arginine translocase subunit TatB [Candidatus Aureabacteria bacterium]|nr:twin-arginine translocase subunit TatB [Candidatus Auribacterota bacterium]NLW94841.1 twin-arginine translocase subunit TatB [Chlamydiota bacterium]HOE28186.1 Sec-independent protein translocase protein TatB [bacterium]HQM52426.1 Sec-independent protein translocase protein TatB [bacterium]
MFDIGGPELAVILLVALLVLGPRRLPEAARFLSRVVREIRNAVEEIKHDLNDRGDLGG